MKSNKIAKLFDDDNPHLAKYIEKYGTKECVSTFEIPPKYKSVDEFCKYRPNNSKEAKEVIKVPANAIL